MTAGPVSASLILARRAPAGGAGGRGPLLTLEVCLALYALYAVS